MHTRFCQLTHLSSRLNGAKRTTERRQRLQVLSRWSSRVECRRGARDFEVDSIFVFDARERHADERTVLRQPALQDALGLEAGPVDHEVVCKATTR